jgi:hypothetical protein
VVGPHRFLPIGPGRVAKFTERGNIFRPRTHRTRLDIFFSVVDRRDPTR